MPDYKKKTEDGKEVVYEVNSWTGQETRIGEIQDRPWGYRGISWGPGGQNEITEEPHERNSESSAAVNGRDGTFKAEWKSGYLFEPDKTEKSQPNMEKTGRSAGSSGHGDYSGGSSYSGYSSGRSSGMGFFAKSLIGLLGLLFIGPCVFETSKMQYLEHFSKNKKAICQQVEFVLGSPWTKKNREECYLDSSMNLEERVLETKKIRKRYIDLGDHKVLMFYQDPLFVHYTNEQGKKYTYPDDKVAKSTGKINSSGYAYILNCRRHRTDENGQLHCYVEYPEHVVEVEERK